jgi:phosphomannomutase
MNFNSFRAYDIRGVYPTDLDEEAFYRMAKAYTALFHPTSMVVGMDARESGPALKQALINGFVDAVVNVIDIGGVTTDMLYYAVGAAEEYSGGIVVSASHNPKEYNGAKMVKEKAAAISSDTGLFEIRDIIKADKDKSVTQTKGGHTRDVLKGYVGTSSAAGYAIKPFISLMQTSLRRRGVVNGGQVRRELTKLNWEPTAHFRKARPIRCSQPIVPRPKP